MKNLYILWWILLTTYNTKAQFSSSPAQPLSVCNATATKSHLQILKDGNGGYFTFWIDNRTGTIKKLYGQHLMLPEMHNGLPMAKSSFSIQHNLFRHFIAPCLITE